MYDFLTGPMMWISIGALFFGFVFRAVLLFKMTKKKRTDARPRKISTYSAVIQTSSKSNGGDPLGSKPFFSFAFRKYPIFATISLLFHVLVITLPLFALGHSIMIFTSFGFQPLSLSDSIIDALTVVCLLLGLTLLVRRIVFDSERIISSFSDYLLLSLVLAPFATGFIAYHQLIDYRVAIYMHITFGHILLISLGWTKLGHMIFFFFSKLFLSTEFNFGRGYRRW